MPSVRPSWLLTACAVAVVPPVLAAPSQAAQVVAHSAAVSSRDASLTFELANGGNVGIALSNGRVLLNGTAVGTYREGGPLASSWRALLSRAGALDPAGLLRELRGLRSVQLSGAERDALETVWHAVDALEPAQSSAPPLPPGTQAGTEPAPPPVPQVADQIQSRGKVFTGDHTISPNEVVDGTITMLDGDLTVQGHVRGDVIALNGNVFLETGGMVDGDVRLLDGQLIRHGGSLGGSVRDMVPEIHVPIRIGEVEGGSPSIVARVATACASLAAMFVALSFMGIGFMFFAPQQLETVADTVWHSFGRSFLAGLFAQPLLVPVLGMVIVGLLLTVVGILVIPFAVAAFLVALFLAVVGGYVAVARAVGEIYLRRRMAHGYPVRGWLTYRYLFYGLIGVLAIWVPAVFFGWIPVAGTVMIIGAGVLTWILATAGFGATLMSRAGIRGTFVRKLDLALTDEHFWEPSELPVARRSEDRPPPR